VTTFRGPPAAEEPGIGALTLPGLLAETCKAHADREAVVSASCRLTYASLWNECRRLARALLASGLAKGTRVAVLLGNRPEWVISAFGITMAGGVVVPLNTWFEPPELDYVVRHCDASLLITQSRLLHRSYVKELGDLERFPFLRELVVVDEWSDFLGRASDVGDDRLNAAVAEVTPFDDAVVIYTSGSTASPKGVLHGHRPVALQSWRFARHLGVDATSRVWSAFPFFWTAGFAMIMGGTLAGGGCLVLQEHFDPGQALHLMEAERVTAAHAWPHQSGQMEDHQDWDAVDLSSLRHVEAFSSFGRHPTVHVDDVWSPRQAFGLTETFTIISSDPADTPRPVAPGSADEVHAGHILPGNAIRIIESATGLPLSSGLLGEIAVKGPTLMKGYLKADSPLDDDGFFHTGDAGFVDPQGRLHWTGRTSDLIKTGGANVSPVEIETVLLHHPLLKVAQAVGVPDPLLGEIVVVCAVAHSGVAVGEDDVRSFLRGKIASYKIPRRVLFVDEHELSYTGNDKIRTEQLRVLATKLMGKLMS
jgi:acyl-CoA synthetase (AMP-forming)/AMP-acid ligase II